MIPPDGLNHYADAIARHIWSLELFLIRDIARRLAKLGLFSPPSLTTLAAISADIPAALEKAFAAGALTAEAAGELLEEAARASDRAENGVFSAAKQQILNASVAGLKGEILTLTRSAGFFGMPAEKAYHSALNDAYLQTAAAASSYTAAARRQVKALAADGLTVAHYKSGHKDHMDVAVRRAVITALAGTTQRISLQNAQELGAELVETSAHSGARPSHAQWQGHIFSLVPNTPYPDFYSSTGYGTGPGLGGYNCRHSFYPFFEGQEPLYADFTEKPPFVSELDGKTYTPYEASQKQRSIERAIRQTKREIAGFSEAGLDDDATAAKAKLRQQQGLYKQFSREAGLLEQPERLGVVLTKNKNSPILLGGGGPGKEAQGDIIARATSILMKQVKTVPFGNLEEKMEGKDSIGIRRALYNAPQLARAVWDKYVDKLVLVDANAPKSYYIPMKGVYLNMEEARRKTDFSQEYYTAFHEFGHNISYLIAADAGAPGHDASVALKSPTYKKTLNQMLEIEWKVRVKETRKQLNAERKRLNAPKVTNAEVYEAIKGELQSKSPNNWLTLSDIMSGLADDAPPKTFPASHTPEYWNTQEVGKEAIAGLYATEIAAPRAEAAIKWLIPKSYTIFKEVLAGNGTR